MDSLLLPITIFCTILFTYLLLDHLYIPKHLPQEPPLLRPKVPYIGHILGLLSHGSKYLQLTRHTLPLLPPSPLPNIPPSSSQSNYLPIYTLPVLSTKIYIITSPDLISAVNRNSKTLAFNPFIAQIGRRMTGHDEATSKIVQHNLNGENGPGYVTDVHDRTVAALAPGPDLEAMILPMVRGVDGYLSGLKKEKERGNEVYLFAWIRRLVTMCSTDAIYGVGNPFERDEGLGEMFWDFDHNLNALMANVFPSLLAPRGSHARSTLAAAFEKYFEAYEPTTSSSSAMIRARHHSATTYGITPLNQGKLEVGTLLGILANTIPSSFYMLVHIYSDEDLLADVRAELERKCVEIEKYADEDAEKKEGENKRGDGREKGIGSDSGPEEGSGSISESTRGKADGRDSPTRITSMRANKKRLLNMLSLRDKTPLLYSVWQELLRVHAQGTSSRFVREDTLLDNGRYLLRKNNIVQMPMAVMHSDPKIWGDDAGVFRARRFLRGEGGAGAGGGRGKEARKGGGGGGGGGGGKVGGREGGKGRAGGSGGGAAAGKIGSGKISAAYRPFGGGASMCPGRFFVAWEVMALVAYLVLRFDMVPLKDHLKGGEREEGKWEVPRQKQESLATNVFPPERDFRVRVLERKGWEGVEWGFKVR